MSLLGTLSIGKSALAVHQAAIQVTGNNVANAGNTDYTRQSANIASSPDQEIRPGVFVGTGVNLVSIQRQIDDALEGRIRSSISDSESADTQQQWLGRVQSVFQSMGDADLSNQMGLFFNSWSNLANKPTDIGLRQNVVTQGQSLASSFKSLLSRMSDLQIELDKRLSGLVEQANGLADQVAGLNEQIVTAEGGNGPSANSLRDERDALLKQLSQLIDIKVQDIGGGSVNVMVGSEPLILGSTNRGIALKQENNGNSLSTEIVNKDDNGKLNVTSGQVGSLLGLRTQIDGVVSQVNTLAGNLIFELNKLHTSGQGLEGFSQATASNAVADTTAALNDTAKTGLAFTPQNGSFVIHVKQTSTGAVTSTLVPIDLDGLNGNDTTLQSLANTLNGINGVSATIANGKLKISAASSGVELSFSQDSSNTLAALGINAFYTGHDATDIAVNADLAARPSLLAAAEDGEANKTALKIAAMGDNKSLPSLNGVSLKDSYGNMINSIAMSANSAKTNAEAASTVKETLLNQREALSGVSLDEEAINLIREQRAFQGSARVISAVDELMKTLLSIT